jgi:hypothetical protein
MNDRRSAPPERRRARRTPFIAAVRHTVCIGSTDGAATVELALAQNLGPSGIELKRPAGGRACLPRTPVRLAFELPDGGDLVHVEGAIVFERAAGAYQSCGVRFESVSHRDRARILRFLK